MPDQSSKKKKRSPDLNVLASEIVKMATKEESGSSQPAEDTRNPHAVALGRLGGKKGGKARAEKLTPEQRKEIARIAARARWKKTEG